MKTFLLTLFFLLGIYCPDSSAQEIGKGGNNAITIQNVQDVTDAKYSIQQDQSGVCKYTEVTENGQTYKALDINPSMFNTNNILMGVSDPSRCPLPGTDFLPDGYPDALAGEFILSGVICVVQSIIMDSMFRIYCTILLWFYQIIYAMIIIYMMFYGLAIIFDLTDEPIKEAPRRAILLLFVFFFAANAEVGFKWVYQTFTTVLTTFSDILTRIQPLYTEGGERVYDNEGRLLDEQGNVWKPIASGTPYVFANPKIETDGTPGFILQNGTVGAGGIIVPTSMELNDGSTHNFEYIPADQVVKYVPYRVPAQQWEGKVEANNSYTVYPVFMQIDDPVDQANINYTTCTVDFKYNDQYKRFELYPRCHQKNWPVIPEFAPYGVTTAKYLGSDNPQLGLFLGISAYGQPVLKPTKLLDQQDNVTASCDEAANPESCRKPFQGILGKIDALFDTVVGDDRSKGLTSMAIALGLWGAGGGTALSLFLMTGILTMFVAFIQILWVYVTAMMGLTFLMMLAPIFIAFKLFKITERMFTSWVSMLVSFMWQPIIVLGFVYVLSNATTLDRLTYIAKNELGTKRYEASKSSGTVKAEFTAPGFLEPLYNKPADYDRQVGTKGDQYKGLANIEGDFISRAQRDLYLQEKGLHLANYYALILSDRPEAEARNNGYKDDVMADINNHPEAVDFINLYTQKQKFTIPDNAPLLGYTGTVELQGVEALHMYSAQNSLPAGYQITITQINDFLDVYREEIGLDDHDAFVGEPFNAATPANPLGETPTCVKYCPAFDPPYDPANAATINPTHQQCKAFCLYTYKDKEEMFSYIVGALIIWIILNAMTGAFMAKIPALAEALSRIYGIASPKIFGTSAYIANPQAKRPLWATQMESDFVNLGSVFDTGIASGRPGALAKITDRLQQLANRTRVVGQDGIPVARDGASMYEESLLSILGVKEDVRATSYDAIKMIEGSTGLVSFKQKDSNGKETTISVNEKDLLKAAQGGGGNGQPKNYVEMEQEIVKKIINDPKNKGKHWNKEDIKKAYIEYLKEQYARQNSLSLADAGTTRAGSGGVGADFMRSNSEGMASVAPSRPQSYGTASRSLDTYDDLTITSRGEGSYSAVTTPAAANQTQTAPSTAAPDWTKQLEEQWKNDPYGATASVSNDRQNNPYQMTDTEKSNQRYDTDQYTTNLRPQEQQSGGKINSEQEAAANAGTAVSALALAQTGQNLANLANAFDPNKPENKQTVAALNNLQTVLKTGNLKKITAAAKELKEEAQKVLTKEDLINVEGATRTVIADENLLRETKENSPKKAQDQTEEDLKKQEQAITDEKLLRERTERENLDKLTLEEQDKLRKLEQEELARLEQITLEQVKVERNREPVLAEAGRNQNEPLIEQPLQPQQQQEVKEYSKPEEQTVQVQPEQVQPTQPLANQPEAPLEQPKPVEVAQNISENVVGSVNPPVQPAKPVSPPAPLFPIQTKKPTPVKSEEPPVEAVSILKAKQEFIVNLGTNSREKIVASTSTNINNEARNNSYQVNSNENPVAPVSPDVQQHKAPEEGADRIRNTEETTAKTENPRVQEAPPAQVTEQINSLAPQNADPVIQPTSQPEGVSFVQNIQPLPQPTLQPVFSQTAKPVSSGLASPFGSLTAKDKEEQKPVQTAANQINPAVTPNEENKPAVSREAITTPSYSYQQTQQVDLDAVAATKEISGYFDALGIQTPTIPGVEVPKTETKAEELAPPQPTILTTDTTSNFGFGGNPTEIKTNPEQNQTPWGWNDGQKAENEKIVSDYLSSQPKTLTESVNEMLSNNQKAEEKRAEELAKEQKNEHAEKQKAAPDAAEIYNEAMQRLKLSGDITNSDVYAEAMVIAAGSSDTNKEDLVRKVIDAVNARMQSAKQAEKKQEASNEAKAEKANPIVNPKNKLKNNNEGST